ncbi:MAG: hypothetical protein U1C33_07940, partial [Candidatus Cloacimonadaceae bacterium]|nr:hypothetical protein [Candidatus Cloacimonadaceae bacterium]
GKTFVAYQILRELQAVEKRIDLFIMEEFNQNNQCEWLSKVFSHKLCIDDPIKDFNLLLDYCVQKGLDFDPGLLQRYFQSLKDDAISLSADMFAIVFENLSDIIAETLSGTDVVFIDDVQWLDSSSLQVFQRLLPKLVANNHTVIIGSRPDYILDVSLSTPIIYKHLENLGGPEARYLLKNEIPIMSDGAVQTILNMTNGNPLFMVEMSKVIKKSLDPDNFILAESDLNRLEKEGIISDTIENLLLHEYEHLDEGSQQMLKVASIIGKAFAIEELTVLSKQALKEDFNQIVGHLGDRRIIDIKTYDPGTEYVFSNYLMRDAIYRTVLLGEKRVLHDQIGSFYEQKYSASLYSHYELIANHFIFAANSEKAGRYCLLAGEKTARMAAYAESNYYFEYALQYQSDPQIRYQILLEMVKNYINQGDAQKAQTHLDMIFTAYGDLVEDQFYYHKTRVIIMTGSYQDALYYIQKTLPKISDKHCFYAIQLRYLDA